MRGRGDVVGSVGDACASWDLFCERCGPGRPRGWRAEWWAGCRIGVRRGGIRMRGRCWGVRRAVFLTEASSVGGRRLDVHNPVSVREEVSHCQGGSLELSAASPG